jgi:mono/diheme cytochrome c family protein
MNENEKQKYNQEYKKEKDKGVLFFPDIIFKDVLISLIVFILLIALAYFIGAPLEEQANPSDTNYTPRPEWYFMFLFQLLKYFPGELEVLGVVVLPTIVVLILFALPFLDKKSSRHPSNRKAVVYSTVFVVLVVIVLSILSVIEAPPPVASSSRDSTALLYTENCAGCHGPTLNIPNATNLHEVIAQGNHEDMPSWSGDLTNDEIDALVGFILSPAGAELFTGNCGECHLATEIVDIEPLNLKSALEEGSSFSFHLDMTLPFVENPLTVEENTSLLNFMIAPDGQRLFVSNCSSCHGPFVASTGSAEELTQIIENGGLHLEMPAWGDRLSDNEITLLANYVIDPIAFENGADFYQEKCTQCHFDRVPRSESFDLAYDVISTGGSHETMPVWGDILTSAQIDALVSYTIEASQGTAINIGQELFIENCSGCHGDFGEGGPNPARSDDYIAPISTAEYLKTRDDVTLREIISQGQPNFGMSPFGLSYGGPLDASEVDAVVDYIRSWQDNPPVELPAEVDKVTVSLFGADIYQGICAQCHGISADGGVGPSLRTAAFKAQNSEKIFEDISGGHQATSMIAWGEILSATQISGLVDFLLNLPVGEASSGEISFSTVILPALEGKCEICHTADYNKGGYIVTSYDEVINSGENGPAVIPGDPDNSLLVQKLLGTQSEGKIMPPNGSFSEAIIQAIIEWIEIGAPNN